MRLTTWIGVLLAALFPLTALAQAGSDMGLDLSDETNSETAPQPEPAESPRPPVDRAAELDAAPRAPRPRSTEVDIASEDRVKSVQRRAFLKSGRFELTPMGFLTLNDAFYPKSGPGGRLAYYVKDSLGLGVRLLQYNVIPNNNARLAKRQLQSMLPKVHPKTSVSLDLLWSPVYGKIAVFNSIKQFELYLVAGAGLVNSQTSDVDGLHLSTHLGIGQRFSVTDWMTVDVSVVETLYADRPNPGNKSVTQHGLSVQGGVGFFLPLSSRFGEP